MWLRLGGILGALGVLLGAFGAHALPSVVTEPRFLETWETGAHYHLVHSLALVAVDLHPNRPRLAGTLFVAGIMLFSGSLYAMSLTGAAWFGAITPLGGVAFVSAWIALAFSRR